MSNPSKKVIKLHEFAVVEDIVKTVLEEAGKHDGVTSIEEVLLEVGDLAFLNPAQLIFAFNTLKKDTLLANAQLLIANMEARVKCQECGYTGAMEPEGGEEYHFATPFIICPECKGPVDVLTGRQCTIRNVRLVVDDNDDKGGDA
ncbi:MAG: hydrogenase maturation nickel metallochaperone HypA [Thermoplasmata archaeon]|nr:hydrogenase maturation nickel metallochaperone HypA [Thermoplasmata archaeon]